MGSLQRPLSQLCRCMKTLNHAQKFKNMQYLPGVVGTRFASSVNQQPDYIFRQLLEYRTYTYTYLLGDPETKECILIDPVIETVERDVNLMRELGLKLKYGVNTHCHADHVTGTHELNKACKGAQSVIAASSGAVGDIKIKEGDFVEFGKFKVEVRSTPGHTDGCISYVWHEKGMCFTGDALLIRGCGRTDFQQGNPEALYNVCHEKILGLPDFFQLWPGHDYTGKTMSTVWEEKKHNTRLTKPLDQFVDIMQNLNLPYPKYLDVALPANLVDGNMEAVEEQKKKNAA